MSKVSSTMFQWALLAVLLSVGGFETPGTIIIEALDFPNFTVWATVITISTGGLILIASFLLKNQSPFTLGMIIIIWGFLSLPLEVANSVTMPALVKFLILGYWLLTLVSALGSALKSEF